MLHYVFGFNFCGQKYSACHIGLLHYNSLFLPNSLRRPNVSGGRGPKNDIRFN